MLPQKNLARYDRKCTVSIKRRQFSWWVADHVEGLSILQTLPSIEIFTVWTKDIRTMQITFWLSVILHIQYWKWNHFGLAPYFPPKKYVESNRNNNIALCCSTKAVPCGWKIIIILQLWPSFWYGATHWVANVRVNMKTLPKKLQEIEMEKGEATAQHSGSVCVFWWCDKKRVTIISNVSSSRSPDGGEEEKTETTFVCVWFIIINNCVVLIRRISCCKCTEGQCSEIIYRLNVERNVYHLKFGINLVDELLVKYSILRGVSGHHDGDNSVDRLTERHFPRRIPPTENKCKPTRLCVICSKNNKIRKTVRYCQDCDFVAGVDRCFQAYHTSKTAAVI